MQFIDVAEQYRRYQGEFDAALAEVLGSGRFVLGPQVKALEERLAAYTGRAHCVSCGSGTDALLMSLMALDIGPGDEVITVPYTWISTAEVIELVRAKTVFCDVDPRSFCLDLASFEAAITPRTKAVIPVSLYGQMPDLQAIQAIADRHGIAVIEDGAQSFGAARGGRRSCGVPGTIGCTSFFPTKTLSCFGEGGAIFVDDAALAERLRRIRTHGSESRGDHRVVGLNGRLETIQAAILLVKLDHFDAELAARRSAAARYEALLGDAVLRPLVEPGSEHGYGLYTIRHPRREALGEKLKAAGIPFAVYYSNPLHLEPVFAHLGHAAGDFPGTELSGAEGMSLPMHPFLEEGEIETVALAVRAAAEELA
jgi:UDP-2-acetamido-2-deoxy-ribo-hexuluronate aminotransferase